MGQLRGWYRTADGDAAGLQQIAEEHPDHADGEVGARGEFGDRLGLRAAQVGYDSTGVSQPKAAWSRCPMAPGR